MKKKKIRAFLRWLRQSGYYIRIRDQGPDNTFSRSVDDEELLREWKAWKRKAPRR